MPQPDKEFNNIKVHTQFSICEGAVKIDELANYCKTNKIKAIGIADSYNLCGALEFAEKISKAGTQPIIGTQINIKYDNQIGKITLYATSEQGYKNLTKLSSLSYLKDKTSNEPYCDIEDLTSHNLDLILLTGNYNDFFGKLFSSNKLKLIQKLLSLLSTTFGNRLYLEIQRHGESFEINYENFLLKASSQLNIPIIAGQEVYYINPDMAEAHDALICIGQKQFVDDRNRFRYNDQHYLKKDKELIKLYQDIPEALENNYNFPKKFSFKPKHTKPVLPSLNLGKNKTAEQELLTQAQLGLNKRFKNFILPKNSEKDQKKLEELYKDRLNHEINIINSMNFNIKVILKRFIQIL